VDELKYAWVSAVSKTGNVFLMHLLLCRKSLREKDKVISKQDTAIRELSVQPAPIVYETSSSQTEVDDDGLWDVQVPCTSCHHA
jgi:hypothetical protein